jgi:ubiquitin C-terminal hydrolase
MSNISEILENLNNTNGSNKLSHIILKLQMKWKNLKGFEVNTTFKKITDQTPLGNSNELLSLNLNDCLKLFTQPEKLTSDNPWYCSKCKKHQEATKQMSLWKLPKYLIITLKRFQATKASDSFGLVNSNLNYLLQNRVVYNKLSTHIDFPLR